MRHCSESSFDEIVKPYFLEENQPVCPKHFSHVYGGMRSLKFIVFECDLLSYCIVAPDVVNNCGGVSINPDNEENGFNNIVYYSFLI